MCGITGFFHYQPQEADFTPLITKMTDQVTHRGPDAGEVHTDSHVALGHRRLSIIDLSAGAHQPMCNADKTVWIVFNGEIYNFPEIRKEFEAENYPFKTKSDTEVLIALYEKYGTEMLPHVNGMFAFAIWDVNKKQLFLARDRMGKKPIFYYFNSEKFVFGSELKSLLVDPDVPREIDPQAIDLYFSFIFVPGPFTMLKNVHKLLPGYSMVITPERRILKQYWDVEFGQVDETPDREAYEEELYDLLYNAVKRRLISDVPLGSFLSGGVDSSAVVGMMAKVNEIPVKTFTIGYEEADYSEADDARFIAEHFNTTHEELTIRPDAMNIFSDLVWHFDEPFGDASAVSTYYVSKMAREFVTVVLSGDGGDELFAGYTRYQRMGEYDKYKRMPGWMKKGVLSPIANVLPLNFPGRNMAVDVAYDDGLQTNLGIYPYIKKRLFTSGLHQTLNGFEISYDMFPHIRLKEDMHPLSQYQYLDIKLYLPDDILVKVDKMSMANSLETRAPLLDYTLAEFAAKLPPEWQIENGVGKAFLKSVLKKFLPERVFTKPKHGFDIPKKHWFKHDLKAFAHDLLLSQRARERGYFDPKLVARVIEDHANEKRDYSVWLWTMLNFEMWHQVFMDEGTRRV